MNETHEIKETLNEIARLPLPSC